jgi:hypothetical protein
VTRSEVEIGLIGVVRPTAKLDVLDRGLPALRIGLVLGEAKLPDTVRVQGREAGGEVDRAAVHLGQVHDQLRGRVAVASDETLHLGDELRVGKLGGRCNCHIQILRSSMTRQFRIVRSHVIKMFSRSDRGEGLA